MNIGLIVYIGAIWISWFTLEMPNILIFPIVTVDNFALRCYAARH